MATTYSPCSRLLSFNGVEHYKEEKNMEMAYTFKHGNANVTMRAWRSIKRLAKRFVRRRRKIVVRVMRRVVLACVVQLKRKVCRILSAKSSRDERHVFLNYDMGSYSKNFDDGKWQQDEVEYYRTRSFAYRYVQASSLAL